MLKKILVAGLVLAALKTRAQEPSDALRYSWLMPSGTARSMAIGGAITSLGGDITSTFVNPAGIAMFKTGEFVLSPGYSFYNNKADYLGTSDKASHNNFNFGTSGFLFASAGSGRSNWKNFTYSLAMNRTANFNNHFEFSGLNNTSSYSEKYLEELIKNNVTDPNHAATDFPFGTSLAFNTYLIDTVDQNGVVTGYRSLATPQTGVRQQQVIDTKGGITTIAFAGSANLGDKLYLGASMGIELLNYRRDQTFKETDATSNTSNNFNFFTTTEHLETSGTGINLKLGLIYKPIDQLRLGLGFHTPTLYNMKDVYYTTVVTDLEGYAGGMQTQSTQDLIGGPGNFQYNYTNPWRVMGGISYVFREVKDVTQQRGFISGDVEYVNYASNSFSEMSTGSSSGYLSDLNHTIDNQFKSAINTRLGGELKFNTWMVRAGFAYYGNPYKNEAFTGSRMNISGGLGYRNKGIFVDLTYVHQLVKDGYYPYRLQDNAYFPVKVGGWNGNVILTFGVKF